MQLVKGLALALLVACLLDPSSSRAADPDPWFGRDKALHFTATAALASGGYGAAAALGDDRRWRLIAGATLGLGAGIAKEALDATGAGDPSWRDLTWDAIGTATGLALAALIDWLWARAASPPQGASDLGPRTSRESREVTSAWELFRKSEARGPRPLTRAALGASPRQGGALDRLQNG